MALRRLEYSGRVGDHAYDAIHAAIIDGDFAVGDRLRIRDLAQDLGTSVMPVREALRRLEEVGLVESIPHRGAIVKGFTHRELLDLYGVRRTLEVDATVAGVPALDDRRLAAMRAEFAAMQAAVVAEDSLEYLARDEAFLEIIYEAAGNAVLVEMIRTLWHRCRSYKIRGAEAAMESADPSTLLTFQEQLVAAAAKGDAAAAGHITADSLDSAIARIRASIDDA